MLPKSNKKDRNAIVLSGTTHVDVGQRGFGSAEKSQSMLSSFAGFIIEVKDGGSTGRNVILDPGGDCELVVRSSFRNKIYIIIGTERGLPAAPMVVIFPERKEEYR